MKIVFFTHPEFLGHQSMPRFTKMLADGMKQRGHIVDIWQPSPKFYNFSNSPYLKKWLGYVDQYLIFPKQVRKKILIHDADVLYVFIDQALGPWVSLVNNKAHVVHCHDFLAQLSAKGYIDQVTTSITGKLYQKFIRNGYLKAKNFICVSQKTKIDLLKFLPYQPITCEVVYNGFNQTFSPLCNSKAKSLLTSETGISLTEGFILHIGGNQWYKNRLGVLDIYSAWRSISSLKVPLLLIGEKASDELLKKIAASVYKGDIYILDKMSDEIIRMAYCGASMLLFPSIAEGFGWPIAEAMASGCPVITTDAAPMTEVAGNAALLIPVKPDSADEIVIWAAEAAKKIEYILNLSLSERNTLIEAEIINAKRFDTDITLDSIEKTYLRILNSHST